MRKFYEFVLLLLALWATSWATVSAMDNGAFRRISDKEGIVSIEVPASWVPADDLLAPFLPKQKVAAVVSAADVTNFQSESGNGVVLMVMPRPSQLDASSLPDLQNAISDLSTCAESERNRYASDRYQGLYDWGRNCYGAKNEIFIAAVLPNDNPDIVVGAFFFTSDFIDFDLVDTILASLQVGDLAQLSAPTLLPQSTPTPPLTPTPSRRILPRRATPTPAYQTFATVKITKLNVRTGPGTNYGIIGSVNQGERLPVTGRAANDCSWLQIQWATGKTGWISGQPTYAAVEGNCSDITLVPTPPPPPPSAKPCVRFDNHFSKEADVTLTMPDNPGWKPLFFKIAPRGNNRQCLAPGRYTFSVGVPGVGSVNGEFTLNKGDRLQVIPIYQEF